ncbi:hypothetical protein DL766_003757 [Monosporascus sp. MC13-8B]|uniref:Major facilitator superfamily (MFS) profile domain-containing protein n=1 Tax=Monosporascus cannonballus TaxID=155416 RepID=A0ABY0H728_9PEZI|nr:hypothetical protein DL762_005034 [Monosporascus cannonballus]RYP01273.1 hypothetical protein DL763_000245 [Monosporascus cannonballus]RYP32868.1 hypothetical protein DL766_003757 [Monosporascus sp. MC13-8B]
MGIGVLEDSYLAKPPGTSNIGENPQSSSETASVEDPKKDGDIILVPQPSDSPNDPLNWSSAWKNSQMLILAFSSGVTVALGPMISPGLVVISKQYDVDLDTVTAFTVGTIILFTGSVTFFTASGANIWGKRPFFDSQIIAGFIIESLGVPAVFGLAAVAYCLVLPPMYFVVMETTYTRPRDNAKAILLDELVADKKGGAQDSWTELEEKPVKEPKEAYVSQLRLFRGRLSQQSFWKGALKPFPLIAFPEVLFSTIFAAPPYSLNPAQIGLTNLPLTIGALIFTPIAGWVTDAVPMWLAKRNNGIYEPEFRLVLMAIALPVSTVGFIGFGISTEEGLPLAWCLVWITMHSVAVPFATQASLSYVIDCHTQDANQAFVTINFVKALMSFIASSVSNGLLEKYGPKPLFIGIAMLNLGISALTIPSYIYGKRLRSWSAEALKAQQTVLKTRAIVLRRPHSYLDLDCLSPAEALRTARFSLPMMVWEKVPRGCKEMASRVLDAMRAAGADILETDFPSVEERGNEARSWDWEHGGSERSEWTVTKVEAYDCINAYLANLKRSPVQSLGDVILYNRENTGTEGGEPRVHPAFPDGQQTFLGIAESRGVRDDRYHAALRHIGRQAREKGIDAALRGYRRGRGEGPGMPIVITALDALMFCDRRDIGQEYVVLAGYPIACILIGVYEHGMPVSLSVRSTGWKEAELVK